VVTNVTAFGAFVDVGVHQDGLVHVSQLSDRFVKDPSEVVKVGDKLKVRVLEVDLVRKRIACPRRAGRRGVNGGAPQAQNAQGPNGGGNGGNGGARRPPVRGDHPRTSAPAQSQKQFSYNPFEKLLRK
jgi:uncharacterized protein